MSPNPLTFLAQERLHAPHFIPALLRSALTRLGNLHGRAGSFCVTGLPTQSSSWIHNLG